MEVILQFWPVFMAFLAFLIWLIRLEARSVENTQRDQTAVEPEARGSGGIQPGA
jgi:hypothetical protein